MLSPNDSMLGANDGLPAPNNQERRITSLEKNVHIRILETYKMKLNLAYISSCHRLPQKKHNSLLSQIYLFTFRIKLL